MPTAVVIDGAYFLRRFKHRYSELDPHNPRDVAIGVMWLAAAHIAIRTSSDPTSFLSTIKLARREGIDVVLDPMGGSAAKDLLAHVDGVRDLPRNGKQ